MARQSNQKLKVLYLMKILLTESSEANILTNKQLIAKLAAYDVPAERKTIYDDIEALRTFGLDIVFCKNGKIHGYYLANVPADIRPMTDAVAKTDPCELFERREKAYECKHFQISETSAIGCRKRRRPQCYFDRTLQPQANK